jgi:hypothetical protein
MVVITMLTILSCLGNRHISRNRLTELGVGLFDKNVALGSLYVDQGAWKWGVRTERGAVGGKGATEKY